MEKRLFSKFGNTLMAHLKIENDDINLKHTKFKILKEKYPYILDEIRDIVNPPFSRKWFKIKLFFQSDEERNNNNPIINQ